MRQPTLTNLYLLLTLLVLVVAVSLGTQCQTSVTPTPTPTPSPSGEGEGEDAITEDQEEPTAENREGEDAVTEDQEEPTAEGEGEDLISVEGKEEEEPLPQEREEEEPESEGEGEEPPLAEEEEEEEEPQPAGDEGDEPAPAESEGEAEEEAEEAIVEPETNAEPEPEPEPELEPIAEPEPEIEPTPASLSWSTFLGGSAGDDGMSIAVDSSGHAYITGFTLSSNFPKTFGAFDTTYGGNNYTDAFVTKLSNTGSVLLYSTYLGGSANDYGYGIAVDGSGRVYVTGYTYSSDFPTTGGAFDTTYNGGSDAFVAKLNYLGDVLIYSTYFGLSSDDYSYGIAVDGSENAYFTGQILAGGTQGIDAFVVKLNSSGSHLVYSNYLGGTGSDYGESITVDDLGCAYVAGHTTSADFPTTAGVLDTTYAGNREAFVVKLSSSGASFVYSTYLGGSGYDWAYDIAVDDSGNAYVTGSTTSSDFPTTPDAFDTTYAGGIDVFVAKLNSSASELVYSTYIGGSSSDEGNGIAVDASGRAYLTGYTSSSDFPMTPDALDAIRSGVDVFVTELNSSGSDLAYSTYLGGIADDFGKGIVLDDSGYAYVTGYTSSFDFPTTEGAFDTTLNSPDFPDVFVTKLWCGGGG